jgi:biotin operon repressor
MIEKGRVISLKDVSVKFDCSERTIKRMIKTLREQGYNINYCKKTKKYYREFK